MMSTILLGNTAPVEAVKIDDTTAVNIIPRPDLGNVISTFYGEAEDAISAFGTHHSEATPAWVESDDPKVAKSIAARFDCPTKRPASWNKPKKVAA